MKMTPFITREAFFGEHVSKLVFAVSVSDLDLGVPFHSVKQQIKRNSVSSGHVSHRWTSTVDDHFDHGLVIFEHLQLRFASRKCPFVGT